jgi:hypothetical protein
MNDSPIRLDEKVCYNCKYRLWLVGLGLGVRCGYEHFKNEDDSTKPAIPIIPHLRHTCNKFEFRNEDVNEKQS